MNRRPPNLLYLMALHLNFIIYVGEADSAFIECDGHYMLIDGGNLGGTSFLYSYLKNITE